MEKILNKGFMEVVTHLPNGHINIEHKDLLKAAEDSQIHTFGWPIGVVLSGRPEYSPKPYQDGIKTVAHIKEHVTFTGSKRRETFDYWDLKKNGDYYFIQNLFEDMRSENSIFFDTRIIRITEVFMHIVRLYRLLGVKEEEPINMRIKHGGLRGRILTSANPERHLSFERKSEENEIETIFQETLHDLDFNIKDLVYKAISDLTMMFDFLSLSKDKVVDPIVDNFISGKIH